MNSKLSGVVMYGMIHQAIREMSTTYISERDWQLLMRDQAFSEEHFISAEIYSDELTIGLVSAVSDRLNLPIQDVLYKLGEYWIEFAASGRYGAIMSFIGSSLFEFINNLDRMHSNVNAAMPGAKLPSFKVIAQNDAHIAVEYISEREGLYEFVSGLFSGLLKYFGIEGSVNYSDDGGRHIFSINTRP